LLEKIVKEGFKDRILLSYDASWYTVGEVDKGRQKISVYT